MHVRTTIFEGEPARIDDLVAFVNDRGVAHVRSLDGNLGLTMTTDRDAGRCEVAVPFTSLDALLDSTGAVGPMRDIGDAIMTARENPEVLEILCIRPLDPTRGDLTGAWQSTVRFSLEIGSSNDLAKVLIEQVSLVHLSHPDVRAVELRATGSVCTLSLTCASRANAEAALASVVRMCSKFTGISTVSTSTQQIVIDARPLNQPVQQGPASSLAQ